MLISVNGFQEAEKYPVLFNNSEIMLDNNRDVFYVKAVDATGRYTMSTYEFKQIENEQPLNANNLVTKQQFDTLNGKIDYLLQQLGQPSAQQAQYVAQPIQVVQPIQQPVPVAQPIQQVQPVQQVPVAQPTNGGMNDGEQHTEQPVQSRRRVTNSNGAT